MAKAPSFLIVIAGALLLTAGCGRKGDLDTPYDAALEARKEAQRLKKPVPPEPEKPVKDRPFILDPLL